MADPELLHALQEGANLLNVRRDAFAFAVVSLLEEQARTAGHLRSAILRGLADEIYEAA